MRIVYFTHSLLSCWNHGNAHFLRGVLDELRRGGHEVVACEPADSWSLANLTADHGACGLAPFHLAYPDLVSVRYPQDADPASLVAEADLVIVHEWTDPALVGALGNLRRGGARFKLLFHDTHHRAVSEPDTMRAYDLDAYDGILAFGEALSEIYRSWGWGQRVWTWHEAADLRRFKPPTEEVRRKDIVWIGNWGDGERADEIETFLLEPSEAASLGLDIYGVRYPPDALETLDAYGARYRGWAANALVPEIFSRHLATVHVPRRYYATVLPGIPTIRVFEALACGIPLITAPWDDCEALFRPNRDYLVARDGDEMSILLRDILFDEALRADLVRSGLETIRARHSCAHRADELLAIYSLIDASAQEAAA